MLKQIILGGLLILPLTLQGANLVAKADIINNAGKKIGKVTLTQGTRGVIVNIKAKDLSAGYHGMHFHAIADCSDNKTGFKESKGHVNPFKKPHGFLATEGPHEGNLPNLIVTKKGTVEVELYTQMISLVADNANLLDQNGSALIIHKNKDNHLTQPIGGSGDRVACATIK